MAPKKKAAIQDGEVAKAAPKAAPKAAQVVHQPAPPVTETMIEKMSFNSKYYADLEAVVKKISDHPGFTNIMGEAPITIQKPGDMGQCGFQDTLVSTTT